MADNFEFRVTGAKIGFGPAQKIYLTDAQATERMHNLSLLKKGKKGEPSLYKVLNPIELKKDETFALLEEPGRGPMGELEWLNPPSQGKSEDPEDLTSGEGGPTE